MVNTRMFRFGAILAGGVVGAGLLNHAFTTAGYDGVGTVAWVVGYLLTVGVLWYRYVRPLELTGPSGKTEG